MGWNVRVQVSLSLGTIVAVGTWIWPLVGDMHLIYVRIQIPLLLRRVVALVTMKKVWLALNRPH